MEHIRVIDSHTGGEPTRVVVEGGPPLKGSTLDRQKEDFERNYDWFRSALINEPRGSDQLVGALLCSARDSQADFGVIFFNNVGYLGMCVHGTIGLVRTLHHTGTVQPGDLKIETPVGTVSARLHENGEVSVTNVPSYRYLADLAVEVEGHGNFVGDVAWGGNWFFLVEDHPQVLDIANVARLTQFAWEIRRALRKAGVTGKEGSEIDHIELFGPPGGSNADSRNFVLCPGGAYDRSPCGTGTSAKLACLYARGDFQPGDVWRQESIVGSLFEGSIELKEGRLYPTIRGAAYLTAEARLLLDPADPFIHGI